MQGFTRNLPYTSSLIASYTSSIVNSGSAETDLYVTTIPAGKLAANGNMINAIYYIETFVGSASAKTLRAYFSGTKIFDNSDNTQYSLSQSPNTTDQIYFVNIDIIRASSSSVKCLARSNTTYGGLGEKYTSVSSITLGGPLILKITGQGGSSSDLSTRLGRVIFFN